MQCVKNATEAGISSVFLKGFVTCLASECWSGETRATEFTTSLGAAWLRNAVTPQ